MTQDIGICIRPCCGAERVGERHCHRSSGDRSAHETRRVGAWINFLLGVWVPASRWVLSSRIRQQRDGPTVGIELIVAVPATSEGARRCKSAICLDRVPRWPTTSRQATMSARAPFGNGLRIAPRRWAKAHWQWRGVLQSVGLD
jgi:hypothetical protein